MKTSMQHQFSQIPSVNIPRSVFNRSHGHKTTFDEGLLIPIYVDEALPGDTFHMKATVMARLLTPIAPIMDNMYLDTFYFAVPNRLIWENWQRFCGEKTDPSDDNDYLVPQITCPAGGWTENSLADYFGLPTKVENADCSALPFRAYNLIWNEWFRDQNLYDSRANNRDDGPDASSDYTLWRRAKRHDYFTSALPWPQKGDPVDMPMGTSAPVIGNGNGLRLYDGTNGGYLYNYSTGADVRFSQETTNPMAAGDTVTPQGPSNFNRVLGVSTSAASVGLVADLTNATAPTINALREAFQLQRMYERDARGGTRYTEIVRSHFGVVSPDSRLQRPEYLGGSSQRINVTAVPQTSETGTTPQGNLAAFGIVADSNGGFNKSFTEHCTIIGLACVRADVTYQQGIPRMFSRQTRFDFYWPALANLGEQEILNKEIYFQNTSADNEVFGYQERFAEYRYYPSKITGEFRSNAAASLDSWHLAQEFGSLPTLGATFIQEAPPISRVVAVANEPHFKFDSYFELRCARPMPVYSVPGLIDHF